MRRDANRGERHAALAPAGRSGQDSGFGRAVVDQVGSRGVLRLGCRLRGLLVQVNVAVFRNGADFPRAALTGEDGVQLFCRRFGRSPVRRHGDDVRVGAAIDRIHLAGGVQLRGQDIRTQGLVRCALWPCGCFRVDGSAARFEHARLMRLKPDVDSCCLQPARCAGLCGFAQVDRASQPQLLQPAAAA